MLRRQREIVLKIFVGHALAFSLNADPVSDPNGVLDGGVQELYITYCYIQLISGLSNISI